MPSGLIEVSQRSRTRQGASDTYRVAADRSDLLGQVAKLLPHVALTRGSGSISRWLDTSAQRKAAGKGSGYAFG